MAKMIARLSGKEQETIEVSGDDFGGFFVHKYINIHGTKYSPWTVSLRSEGQNLGANFSKRSEAVGFAKAMASHYDGNVSAENLITQFRGHKGKPSCADLGEQFNMHQR